LKPITVNVRIKPQNDEEPPVMFVNKRHIKLSYSGSKHDFGFDNILQNCDQNHV